MGIISKRIKIGVIGSTGQLAKSLKKCPAGSDLDMEFVGRDRLDLSWSPSSISEALSVFETADIIINAAAYTAVDKAESEPDIAHAVNGIAPGIIANYCHDRNIPLIHISTDYVFNGQGKAPLLPNHQTGPLGVYGETKYQGEVGIKAADCNYAILRTSWVYDAESKNFLTTMLRLGQTLDALNVVHDQIGRPTFSDDLASACIACVIKLVGNPPAYTGTYHVSGSGKPISWADFAREIFALAEHDLKKNIQVNNIPSSEYPTPAKRPLYSVLDTEGFQEKFDMKLPNWQLSLRRAFKDWQKNNRG